jgi:uncharacterized membrane protein YhaH (DUF805 family)
MDWVYLYTGFTGRIGRKLFWIGFVVLAAAEISSQILAYAIQGEKLGSIVDLAFTYPEFSLVLKRAYDRNIPMPVIAIFFAVAVLVNFLALAGWINDSIEALGLLPRIILGAWAIYGAVLLIELGFRRGTEGPNRFGPDPLQGRT